MIDLPKEMKEIVATLQRLGFNLEHKADELHWNAEEKAEAKVRDGLNRVERTLAFGMVKFLTCTCGSPGMDEDELEDIKEKKGDGVKQLDITCPFCYFWQATLDLLDYDGILSGTATEEEVEIAWKKWADEQEPS